jgi:hypothetical protein
MLLDQDDFPLHQVAQPLSHVMNGHPNAYDRFWFNGYTEDYYFAVALGIYPNRGVIDAAFSLVRDGIQRSVFASGPLNGRDTVVGPIRVEITEPMAINRVVVDAPDQGLICDLTYRRRTLAFEEPRQTFHDGPRIFMDVTRATQLGTWEGFVDSPDGRLVVESGTYGTKDRSWGVRPVGEPLPGAPGTRAPQLCFLWAPLNFPTGAVHYMSFDEPDGRPTARTALHVPLVGDGEPRHVAATLTLEPSPGTRRVRAANLLTDEAITLTPLFTFHMRGAGYSHPEFGHGRWHGGDVVGAELINLDEVDPLDFHHLHVQQVVRAQRHDEVGLGVLESLIVGPYEPMELTGLLDGAS